MKKRILPALLALCMVISLLPVMAFAENVDEGQGGGQTPGQDQNDGQNQNPGSNDEGDGDGSEEGNTTETTVIYCACQATHAQWIDGEGESAAVKTTCQNTVAEEGELCASCAKKAEHNPCGVGGCTKLKDHAGDHNNESCLSANDTEKAYCGATTHNDGCPKKCDLDVDAWKAPGGTGEEAGDEEDDDTDQNQAVSPLADAEEAPAAWVKDGKAACTLTIGHSGPHNNEKCIKDAKCGASTHAPDCPVASASGQCGKGGCDLAKGHTGNHNNSVCLGANDDGHCAADEHIAGCSKYDCECDHSHTKGEKAWDKTFDSDFECTSKAGCTFCNQWNTFVASLKASYAKAKAAWDKYSALTDAEKEKWEGEVPENPGEAPTDTACNCLVCAPNPPTGALTNDEGETVENPVAGENGTPTKVEEFKDADKMTAEEKDAVQVMLDNGWMQGTGEEFDIKGAADTNVVLAVIARMAGQEGITGTEWANLAKAWAEDNDLTEGIEITKADMARKDIVLMLWRLAGKPGSEQELEFDDVEGLEGDYLTALKWAVETGIVKGNGDGTVSPDGTLKRSELAIMVSRYAANVK